MSRLLWFVMTMFMLGTASANRVGRPMIVHRVPELGLEIWTEQDPEWETTLDTNNGAPTFVAETPALTYPPAHMSWTSLPLLKFEAQDLEAAARGALHQVAANHHVRSPREIVITPSRYGDLVGYETEFGATSQSLPTTVRVFCGHQTGKPAVLMQVSTLSGKLPHLSEHLRRSWNHVRYLE